MRRRERGVTLVELVTTLGITLIILTASTSLMWAGTRSFERSNIESELHSKNAQGIRKVAETIRGAMVVSVSADGTTISCQYPRYNTFNDAATGEKEYYEPLTADPTSARSFTVDFTARTLKDNKTGKVLVKNIQRTDPHNKSTQFNLQYAPFQLTTIGSVRAITINLITQMTGRTGTRNMRMKTTVILRNTAG